jgi:Domain of unknown function (DUF4417)
MLIRPRTNEPTASRNLRRERKSWHDASVNMPSLGCSICPERALCGALHVAESLFSCLDYCCQRPESCGDKFVCPNNPHFVNRIREVGGFDLGTTKRGFNLARPELPSVIPMVFNGSSRKTPVALAAAAIPLARMFNRKNGRPRHRSRDALCASHRLDPKTRIVLSGTDTDAPIERWWELGEKGRRRIIRALRKMDILLATTPNYSLFTEQPRWDDLHAMKRIAIVHSEFLNEGLPCALHVNGRTDTDFRRWTDYIVARPEVSILAYEFTTGTGWRGRQERHATWLAELARNVGRPMHLVVRGGIDVLPTLIGAFARINIIDTSSFVKAVKRRRVFVKEGRLSDSLSPTAIGQPVDTLFRENVETIGTWLQQTIKSAQHDLNANKIQEESLLVRAEMVNA